MRRQEVNGRWLMCEFLCCSGQQKHSSYGSHLREKFRGFSISNELELLCHVLVVHCTMHDQNPIKAVQRRLYQVQLLVKQATARDMFVSAKKEQDVAWTEIFLQGSHRFWVSLLFSSTCFNKVFLYGLQNFLHICISATAVEFGVPIVCA